MKSMDPIIEIDSEKLKSKDKKNNNTTITLSRENCARIKQFGTCGMSIDDVLTMILNKIPGVYQIDTRIEEKEGETVSAKAER